MRLRLIQYHCGRLFEAMTSNPQVKYHAHRIGEIARDDLNRLVQCTAKEMSVWWRKLKSRL